MSDIRIIEEEVSWVVQARKGKFWKWKDAEVYDTRHDAAKNMSDLQLRSQEAPFADKREYRLVKRVDNIFGVVDV